MKTKRLSALILAAMLILSTAACAPKEPVSASSHIHTESEHEHDHDTNSATASQKTDSEKNTSSKITGVQRPNKNDNDTQVDNIPDLSDDGLSTSKKLFEDLEKLNTKALHMFRVKGTTYASTSYVAFDVLNKNLDAFNVIKDTDTIQHLKDALEYSTWTPKKHTVGSTPNIVIYFDDKIHLNIEGKVNDVYWMSLNSDYGNVYYVVPENVHENVMAFCYELEK